jgi:hypothetical protein
MVDLVRKIGRRWPPNRLFTSPTCAPLTLPWRIPETFYVKEWTIIYGAFFHISQCWMKPPWSPNDRLLGRIIRACPTVAHQTHSRVQPYLNEALVEPTKQHAPKDPSIT